MTPPDIFKVCKTYHPEIAKNTLNYKEIKGRGNAIEGTLVNKQHYIFVLNGDKGWSLYYGSAVKEFERRMKSA